MNETQTLAPYTSPRERELILDDAAKIPGVSLIRYGESVEGRPLRAVCFKSKSGNPHRILCTANIHGPEYISSFIAQSLITLLSGDGGIFSKLREMAEIWVIPCLNPDGYARTWELNGRGPIAVLRTNSNGVDLNRNFPLPPGGRRSRLPGAGSYRKGAITYRGEKPLSEPESSSLEKLLTQKKFHACASLHSFSGAVIPARVTGKKEFRTYKYLAGSIKNSQPHFQYRRISSRLLDIYTGELEDHLHHNHRCWSVCIETMTLFRALAQNIPPERIFWFYNPRDPGEWVENELHGLNGYFLAALELGSP